MKPITSEILRNSDVLRWDSRTTTVWDCQVFELPRIQTAAGAITALNNGMDLPFEVRRVYYLYDVPGGAQRGGHAHKELIQLIVAASGSFDVIIDDGRNRKVVSLNRPYLGLLIVPGIWRELVNFSSGSISLVLASDLYREEDYIRSNNLFKQIKIH
ncbi:MAG: WxcM-like domain-containing protein [Gammaproteobacteria bacterium]|nr:MAG: WxcM-like domain-containing protein [Gammaproteobacteria bacterium]